MPQRSDAPTGASRIPYGDDPSQFGDLWLPSGAGPHPVVVLLHGGYWRAKYDINYTHPLAQDMAAHGVAVWNLEYRRVGQKGGGWPGTFEDVATGFNMLGDLATQHPLDLARVVVMGHSAGGHLAFWLAAGQRGITPPAKSVPIRAAISLAGVLALHRAWEMHLSNDAVVGLLGGTPAEYPDRYAAASPAASLPFGVPQILIHGTTDDSVPYVISEEYARQAQAEGDAVEFITQPGSGHFEMVTVNTPEWRQVVETITKAFHDPS